MNAERETNLLALSEDQESGDHGRSSRTESAETVRETVDCGLREQGITCENDGPDLLPSRPRCERQ